MARRRRSTFLALGNVCRNGGMACAPSAAVCRPGGGCPQDDTGGRTRGLPPGPYGTIVSKRPFVCPSVRRLLLPSLAAVSVRPPSLAAVSCRSVKTAVCVSVRPPSLAAVSCRGVKTAGCVSVRPPSAGRVSVRAPSLGAVSCRRAKTAVWTPREETAPRDGARTDTQIGTTGGAADAGAAPGRGRRGGGRGEEEKEEPRLKDRTSLDAGRNYVQ